MANDNQNASSNMLNQANTGDAVGRGGASASAPASSVAQGIHSIEVASYDDLITKGEKARGWKHIRKIVIDPNGSQKKASEYVEQVEAAFANKGVNSVVTVLDVSTTFPAFMSAASRAEVLGAAIRSAMTAENADCVVLRCSDKDFDKLKSLLHQSLVSGYGLRAPVYALASSK